MAGAREELSTSIKISVSAGNIIGLKFSDRGHTGTIRIDYRFLWIIGPLRAILRPVEPRGVDKIIPSPQRGARMIKSFYSDLT